MHDKITIIIPVYNTEKYLKRCLDSVIHQSYSNLEIICIDDKSTDGSRDILLQYASNDSRISLILLDKNAGVSHARNLALERSTGSYVCFLDSDDYLEQSSCEDLYNNIVNQNSDLSCGGHIKVNKFDKRISAWLPTQNVSIYPNKEIYNFTKHRNVTQKLFKMNIIKENNILFRKDLHYMEDALFLVTYLKKSKLISSVKKVLYNVQINPESLCRNKNYTERRENDKANASLEIKNILDS